MWNKVYEFCIYFSEDVVSALIFSLSGAYLNSSSSSSHILILSSNCTFDTIVVLVVMFIT